MRTCSSCPTRREARVRADAGAARRGPEVAQARLVRARDRCASLPGGGIHDGAGRQRIRRRSEGAAIRDRARPAQPGSTVLRERCSSSGPPGRSPSGWDAFLLCRAVPPGRCAPREEEAHSRRPGPVYRPGSLLMSISARCSSRSAASLLPPLSARSSSASRTVAEWSSSSEKFSACPPTFAA